MLILPVKFYFSQQCEPLSNNVKIDVLRRELCPKNMLADLSQLKAIILETHPAPFEKCSEAVFNNSYERALIKVQEPRTLLYFSEIVCSFLEVLSDAHTSMNPRDLLLLCDHKRPFAPFYLKEINGLFYLANIYKKVVPIGVQVLSVNNYVVDSLYQSAAKYAPYEGIALNARTEIVQMMMGLVFNIFNENPNEPVSIRYVSFKGDTLNANIPVMRVGKYVNKNPWQVKEDLVFRIHDTSAYLGLRSFESRRERRYKRGIDAFFKKVEQDSIDDIVIDVRGNRGGYVLLLEYVLSYINSEDSTFDLNYLYKRSKLDRFETLSRLKKVDFVKKALRVYPKGMLSKEYDFYKSEKGTISSILYKKELKNRTDRVFKGNCTILTNGLSMSSSVLFASWFRGHNRGTIVGTPCFGTMEGTHGNPATIVLSNSLLPISISTLKLSTTFKDGHHEIIPEVSVRYNISDLIEGKDPFRAYY